MILFVSRLRKDIYNTTILARPSEVVILNLKVSAEPYQQGEKKDNQLCLFFERYRFASVARVGNFGRPCLNLR